MWLTPVVDLTKHVFCFGMVWYDIAVSELHSATENNTTAQQNVKLKVYL